MKENELKAKALIIGMKLKTLNWSDWSGTKAHNWCIEQAQGMNIISNNDLNYIAYTAMNFVIS